MLKNKGFIIDIDIDDSLGREWRKEDQFVREKDIHKESDSIRDKLRNENYILREKLKVIKSEPKGL